MKLLVTYFSVSAALYTQKLLGKRGAPCEVVPVPRSVSSSCGYALEVMDILAAALAQAMNEAGVEWSSIYLCLCDGKNERYEPMYI